MSATAPPPPDLARDRAIARDLARTWDAFFARFGRLTPVQRAAIPPILAGQDALICAATATGKTEAACAPLLERRLGRAAPWLVFYISPTRALINDLYARLATPLAGLSLRLARRTSDYRAPLETLPHVLLTTPESFDSLLCRGRRQGPEGHALAGVVAVVLDEIHLLHGTPRGEQVRWLLERLRRLRQEARRKGWTPDDGLQVVGLSATTPDPAAVRTAYLNDDAATIVVPGGRMIETVTAPCASARTEVALPAYLAACPEPQKVLVFANERRRVDDLTARLRRDLRGIGYRCWAHHGSLEREEREAAEAAMRGERQVVLFATSTLEIGIDIGDIDLIVLDGPAPDIPALLQRIGRGNRRSGATRVLACAESLVDAAVQAAMIEAARAGWLGPAESGPHYNVARQQVASYIYQGRRITRPRATVQDLLARCAPPVLAAGLLDAMVQHDELREDARGLRLGDEWLDRQGSGEIHSTIEDQSGAAVVDEASGRTLARVVTFQGGRGLRAGGQLLEVRRWQDFKLEVRRVSDVALAQGDWRYAGRPWLRGAGQPQALRRYLGLAEDAWTVVDAGDDAATYAFHFGGARRQAVLELLAAAAHDAVASADITGWFLRLPAPATARPSWLARADETALAHLLPARLRRLETTLGRPAGNRRLPFAARLAEVHAWLRLTEEVAWLRAARWETPPTPEAARLLRAVAHELADRDD